MRNRPDSVGAGIPDALSTSMTALSQIFVGDDTVAGTLLRVADLANTTISGSDMASVSMLVKGRPHTEAFTDSVATQIDEAQYRAKRGPSVDALRYLQVQRVEFIVGDKGWPSFAEAAADLRILSSLSLPLVARHAAIGVINCYSRSAAAFTADDERIGDGFADASAVAIANAQAFRAARDLSEQMRSAMQSRATIEQAKGILIAEEHCDADRAFAMLVQASQAENLKLSDIADRLVRQRLRATEIGVPLTTWLSDPMNTDRRASGRARRAGHIDRRQRNGLLATGPAGAKRLRRKSVPKRNASERVTHDSTVQEKANGEQPEIRRRCDEDKVFGLRCQGQSFALIAETMGHWRPSEAHDAFNRAIRRKSPAERGAIRVRELTRLDALAESVRAQVEKWGEEGVARRLRTVERMRAILLVD